MDWHVRWHLSGAEQVEWYGTPEQAIERACQLLDKGHNVLGIGDTSASAGRHVIARIYYLRPDRK